MREFHLLSTGRNGWKPPLDPSKRGSILERAEDLASVTADGLLRSSENLGRVPTLKGSILNDGKDQNPANYTWSPITLS